VKEEGPADQTEADARRGEGRQNGGREQPEDKERSASRDAPGALGHERGVRVGQDFALEDVVGDIDADEQSGVEGDRQRGEPGVRHPRRRKGQERDQEEMEEVHPHQSQTRRTHEPHEVVVIDPDDSDEEVALVTITAKTASE
jgi:hypothetical protein